MATIYDLYCHWGIGSLHQAILLRMCLRLLSNIMRMRLSRFASTLRIRLSRFASISMPKLLRDCESAYFLPVHFFNKDPAQASWSSSSKSLSVWRASGMSHGMRAQVTSGKALDKAEPTHKYSNCLDSFGAPLGWHPRYSSRRAPVFEEIVFPRLWQPASRAYIVASMPFGQSWDMITMVGMACQFWTKFADAEVPSMNQVSGIPTCRFRREKIT